MSRDSEAEIEGAGRSYAWALSCVTYESEEYRFMSGGKAHQ
jgi:hypothetical protein